MADAIVGGAWVPLIRSQRDGQSGPHPSTLPGLARGSPRRLTARPVSVLRAGRGRRRPIPIACPTGCRSRPARSSPCRSARATWSASSGTIRRTRRSATTGSAQYRAKLDAPPLSRRDPRASSTGSPNYTLTTARHGAAHGAARARRARARSGRCRASALAGPPAGADDAGARQRVLAARRRRPRLVEVRPCRRGRRQRRASSQGLVDAGALEVVSMPPRAAAAAARPGLRRTGPHRRAGGGRRQRCARRWRQDGFSVTLLDGVTGSGKTEVYFEAVAEALAPAAGRR